ncbi:AsnC family transcriptional regulator [Hypnocyclicus thermotrophus]|uniref:AsnC family transcriptional regulator n=1 Tax=Hypnocyclicus thermotrophus TaxID=1627895 RepID=A0AA46DX73_9FUSO|nr:Lrp/AsnC family transcriptional regulator [Hypnocyclicus thermotrophus]TDT67447.1 AsnC family transcriptional regulator [Hypnocyclicus thermotrophus]
MEKIIEILKEDSRATPKDIAIMLGISEEEVKEKIKQLEKDNIILKYTTIINEEKWEDEKVQAFIEVKVSPEREMGFDAIAERIYKFPQVKSLFLMSGGFDFLIVIEGQSLKEVALFVSEKLSTLDYINSTATHFMLKKYKENDVVMEDKEKVDNRLAVMP